jgi:ribosomal protein S18 acetylase RimI-like enzyme
LDQRFQGNGRGTLMIMKLSDLAKKRKIRRVYLEALLQAVGFYKKNGFKKLKRIFKPINSMKMEKIL